MRKQHLLTLALCALFSITTHLSAQEQKAISRDLDQKVEAARNKGLLQETVRPFLLQKKERLAANRLAETVRDATYLNLPVENVRKLYVEQPAAMTLSIPQEDGTDLALELVQQSPLDDNFRVTTSDSKGKAVRYTPGVFYRGMVKGIPGSTVAVSIFDGEIIAVASAAGKGNIVVGRLQAKDNQSDYILYDDNNLTPLKESFCQTKEDPLAHTQKILEASSQRVTADGKCVKVYLECDYALNQNKGGVAGATNYITAVFNNIAVLYANEQINTQVSEVFVWTSLDNYSKTSPNTALTQFFNQRATFNGNLAHLASMGGNGLSGIAWVDVLCRRSGGAGPYAYSRIQGTYNTVPTYSWTVECMTHEMGHNLGSPHTHNCNAWTGGAIDGCGAQAGYPEGSCSAPVPSSSVGGTIMSYCHLTNAGINFNNGFGPQPGNRIRSRINAATCLSTCGGGSGPVDPPACDSVTLQIVTDQYGSEITWKITNASNQVVASGGPYSDGTNGAIINNQLCLPAGCYTLTMMDRYGDGICCSYGNGSYSLTRKATGAVLASGGQYTTQDVKSFCTDGTTAPISSLPAEDLITKNSFEVFPNPAHDQLSLRWSSTSGGAASVQLTDLAGRQLGLYTTKEIKGKNNLTIRLKALPAGVYIVRLHTGDGKEEYRKVMIR